MFVLNMRRFKFSDRKNRILGLAVAALVMVAMFTVYFAMRSKGLAESRVTRKGVALARFFRPVTAEVRGPMVQGLSAVTEQGSPRVALRWIPVKDGAVVQEVFRANQPILSSIELGDVGKKIAELKPDADAYVDIVPRSGEYYYCVIVRNPNNQYPLLPGRNALTRPAVVRAGSGVVKIKAALRDAESNQVQIEWELSDASGTRYAIHRSDRVINSAARLAVATRLAVLDAGTTRHLDDPPGEGHFYYAVVPESGEAKLSAGDNHTDSPVTIGSPGEPADPAAREGMPFTIKLGTRPGVGPDADAVDLDEAAAEVSAGQVLARLRDLAREFGGESFPFHRQIREITFYKGFDYFWSTDETGKPAGSRPDENRIDFSINARQFREGSIEVGRFVDESGELLYRFSGGLNAEADRGFAVEVLLQQDEGKSIWGVLLLLLALASLAVLLLYLYLRFVGKAPLPFAIVLLLAISVLGLKTISQDVVLQMEGSWNAGESFYAGLLAPVLKTGLYTGTEDARFQDLVRGLANNQFNEPEEAFRMDAEGRVFVDADGRIAFDEDWKQARREYAFSFLMLATLVVLLLIALPLLVFCSRGLIERFGNALFNHKTAYLFTLPGIVILFLLVFAPLLYTFVLSTTHLPKNMHIVEMDIGRQFVGLRNFGNLLGVFDLTNMGNFYWTLKTTLIYTFGTVIFQTTIGVLLAMLLNKANLKFRTAFRTLLILPWAIPTYVSALVFSYLFAAPERAGFLNQLVSVMGGNTINWLYDPNLGLIMLILASIWYGFPFIMVVALGALQSIPADIYESAHIEGATAFERTIYITLPMIQPAVMPAIILSTIWTFNNFNFVYLMNQGWEGTDILITRIYDFIDPSRPTIDYGLGAAFSTVIFVILIVYIFSLRKLTNFTEKSF